MTTATARTATAPRRSTAPARPALRLVPARRAVAGRIPFAIVIGVVLLGGLIGLLVLHTTAAQDAFRLHDLQQQSAALGDTEQQLSIAEQQQQAPSALAARARALGMVPTGSIAFMHLRSGRVVGVAKAAPAPPPPPAPVPTPSATAKTKATASSSPTAAAGQPSSQHRRHPRPAARH